MSYFSGAYSPTLCHFTGFFSVNMNVYVNSINIVHGSKKERWKHAHLS